MLLLQPSWTSESSLSRVGLSVDIGALPEREEDPGSVSPMESLPVLRLKRDSLQQRVEAMPCNSKALARLAQAHVQLNEVDDFVSFVKNLCMRHRSAWRAAIRVLDHRLARPHDAVNLLLAEHDINPQDPEVCCALAKIGPGRAEWYQKALRADPQCIDALLAVADGHRKAERFGEAARLYKTAYNCNPIAVRPLCRLGESLVKAGRHEEGRGFLMRVVQNEDSTYDMHAAVMIALSYVVCQQHEGALEACHRVEEIDRLRPKQNWGHRKLALMLKGITLLRFGDLDQSVQILSAAAEDATDPRSPSSESGSVVHDWDVMIESTLGFAETLRGDLVSAERHLERAKQLDGACLGTDTLVNLAYLRQVQGDDDEAQRLLDECLARDNDSPMALLRVGYLHLCQDQIPTAIQFLQKCLQQDSVTLAYGACQKGTAHLYLCVAYYLHSAACSPQDRCDVERLADEQFWLGCELQPDFTCAVPGLG